MRDLESPRGTGVVVTSVREPKPLPELTRDEAEAIERFNRRVDAEIAAFLYAYYASLAREYPGCTNF